MFKKKLLPVTVAFLFVLISSAQTPWNGKKCAVVLTYDDAIDQHLDNAVPLLDSLGLKATFYITAFSQSLQTRLNDWRKVAAKGYELGNHTLYHPCIGNTPGREWVTTENDMSHYTVKRMENEIRMTNTYQHFVENFSNKSLLNRTTVSKFDKICQNR